MSRKESDGGSPLDEFLAQQEEVRQQKIREGNPGRQRRLKKAIESEWLHLLALEQRNTPRDIKKITKNILPETATTVLWMSPSPWTKLKPKELEKNAVIMFVEKSQTKIWASGKKESVLRYFKNIVEDKLSIENPSRIPWEIRKITKGKLTESALQTLWIIPSPWLWYGDDRDYSLDITRSPSVMYKEPRYRDLAVDYMRVLADNLEPPLV